MDRGRKWAAAAAALALIAPLPVSAQSPPATPQYVTYTEEVPCPPSDVATRTRSVMRRRPRAHVHRAIHRRLVVHHPVVRKALAKPHRVAALRRVRPHHHRLVRASDPIAPKRCSVVRRDRLTAASFGLTPESAVLTPVADDVTPGGPVVTQPSSGRAAFGDPVNPSTGGGDTAGGVGGGGSQVVSAAPEPDVWALMLLGVGLTGWALRRRRALLVIS